jgi:ParB family chromosome partitioning protein
LELALVENIQRRDLNPMEKARAFKQLMTLHSWTQDQTADALGMSRPSVANFIRLLDLQLEVQEAVSRGAITMGHARALAGASQRANQLQLLKQILQDDLSVRALEKMLGPKSGSSSKSTKKAEPYLKEFEQKLMDKLGVRVQIQPDSIVISYTSKEELTRVLKRLDVI